MRRPRWLLMLSFAVVCSLLAACAGGGKEGSQQGTSEFSDLAGKFAKATFKVTYTVSGSGTSVTQGSMTMYKKGDNLRIDLSGEIEGQQETTIIIMRPDQSYLCSDMPGTGGGACFSTPIDSGQGPSDVVAELEKTLTDPNVTIVSTSSRQIAGEPAKCYTVRTSDSEGDSEICLSSEGVPLFSKGTTAGEETSLEATTFGRDVSDSDFEPPYPVSQDSSGLPSGQ